VGSVAVSESFPSSVHEAEACWYDVSRWPQWVDELDHVVSVRGEWPQVGAAVVWQSGPAGRGRVTERVIEYEPLGGYTVEVEDDSITGEQSVSFEAAADGVDVQLALRYRIKRRSPLTRLIDVLFVRRLMVTSLEKTLSAFGAALAESRPTGVG
jgi:polyketide cyclase/dehydrase/lipid transport protein